MPYLHWETDRRRQYFAALVDKEADRYQKREVQEEKKNKLIRHKYREGLTLLNTQAYKEPENYSHAQVPARTLNAVVEKFNEKAKKVRGKHETSRREWFKKSCRKKSSAHTGVQTSFLGRLLFSAAMLCEAMLNFKDKKLLEKYVHENPPMHPRNTLDQVYYWALRSTNKRDRDQVVYRGTRAHPERLHRYDTKTASWPCFEKTDVGNDKDGNGRETSLREVCGQCTENSRKVARVVMVDQLWMWVLDEHTIITCFPKRYGHNREDQSGIHKSIRLRLGSVDCKQIKSAFDVALIIIDECCRMFFDRSKTRYLQPQVMDIFSEAIGIVVSIHPLCPTQCINCS